MPTLGSALAEESDQMTGITDADTGTNDAASAMTAAFESVTGEGQDAPSDGMADEIANTLMAATSGILADEAPAEDPQSDVPSEAPPEKAAEPAPETPAKEAAEPEQKAEPAAQEAVPLVPSMTPEEKALLGKLPGWAQQFVKRRDDQVTAALHKKTQEFAAVRQERDALATNYGAIEKELSQHEAELKQHGLTRESYLNRLHELNKFALQDTMGYLEYVVKTVGINPRELAQRLGVFADDDDFFADAQPEKPPSPAPQQMPPAAPAPQPAAQPAIDPRASAKGTIAEFRDRRKPDGTLAHPFFSELEGEMTTFLVEKKAGNLDEAYRLALNARVNASRSHPPAEDRSGGDRALERAQKANMVAPSAPTAGKAPPPTSMDTADVLRESFAALMGR
jgi:hypothetical protein